MDPTRFDAIIVGARCAGSTLALALARQGQRVALIDKDVLPSNVISTHFLFPNMVARLEQLDILERVRKHHRINPLQPAYTMFGHRIPGSWAPIDGIDHGISLRRTVLDTHLYEAAIDAGALGRLGEKVVDLVGAGTPEEPIRGVVLEGGDALHAPIVIGADGRSSIVARTLGLEKRDELRGDQSMMFAYFTGLPKREETLVFEAGHGLAYNRYRCEDDVEIVTVGGDAAFTRGSAEERERRFAETVAAFRDSINPGALAQATRVSELIVAPETMLRGYFRQAAGPGWALVGDAGHFKHPATAQGICDAIEQALWVADTLGASDPSLAGYESWRDTRAADHYPFSYAFATIPPDEVAEPLFRGLASDPDASKDFLESFERLISPSAIFTSERVGRWLSSN